MGWIGWVIVIMVVMVIEAVIIIPDKLTILELIREKVKHEHRKVR